MGLEEKGLVGHYREAERMGLKIGYIRKKDKAGAERGWRYTS